MKTFEYATRIGVSADEAFRWHAREGAFERLQPPWEKIEVIQRTGDIKDGHHVKLAVRIGPITKKWFLEHRNYVEGVQFTDIQLKGPFSKWQHTHHFEKLNDQECILKDTIHYELPFGILGERLLDRFVKSKLKRLFKYRHNVTKRDLETHKKYKRAKSLHIVIAGASGLIGSVLVPFLKTGNHKVSLLSRINGNYGIHWDPETGDLNPKDLEGCDVVINLAGENIGSGRWSEEKKRKILQSRIKSTDLLSQTLAQLDQPPSVFINASAIGIYGVNAEDVDEASPSGSGFLAQVCREWEAATEPAQKAGIRTVITRFGIILSPKGGVLAKLLVPFKLGLGGVIGTGKQWMSWVAIDDVLGALLHVINHSQINGPLNVVAPNPVTNRVFSQTLGQVLHRPTLFPLPAFAAKILLGKERAEELVLSSVKAEPRVLEETGYEFHYLELEPALNHLTGK